MYTCVSSAYECPTSPARGFAYNINPLTYMYEPEERKLGTARARSSQTRRRSPAYKVNYLFICLSLMSLGFRVSYSVCICFVSGNRWIAVVNDTDFITVLCDNYLLRKVRSIKTEFLGGEVDGRLRKLEQNSTKKPNWQTLVSVQESLFTDKNTCRQPEGLTTISACAHSNNA